MSGRLRWAIASPAAAGAVAVVVAVSVGGSGSGAGGGGGGGGGTGGEPIAPFALTSLDGERISLPRSGRPGALFLTVSSCLSCLPAAQALGELKAQLGDRVDAVWIGIDPGDPPEQVRARRDAMGNPPYPFAIDRSGTLAGRFAVQALGTTIVYDADAEVVAKLVEPTRDELVSAFREAGVS